MIEVISKFFFFWQLFKIINNIILITIGKYININIKNFIYNKVIYFLNSNNVVKIFLLPHNSINILKKFV